MVLVNPVNILKILSRSCRRTHHARSHNQVRSCCLRLHMMHCSTCHPLVVGTYNSDSCTSLRYRLPSDPPEKLLVVFGVPRVAH
jgi:hypothetical protein